MMSPAPTPPSSVQVELWENERRWVGGGFSKMGLLPTERGPFSTDDGSVSWRTLDEAGASLLGRGWVWAQDSEYTYEEPHSSDIRDCDGEGWRYAIDFSPGHLERACSTQGLAHFVRRRRIRRNKTFDITQFATNDGRCENCDSDAVDALSSKLLEALAVATLLQRDAEHPLTDAVALPLKAQLIESLGIGSPFPDWSEKVDPSTRLHKLLEELDKFGDKRQNVLLRASQIFQPRSLDPPKGLSERMVEISARFFGNDEREAIAGIIIRQLDPECMLHCGRENCGYLECEYFRVDCPNDGCNKKVSRKLLSHHANETCEFKIIDCPNGCGDTFPRNQREAHLAKACSLRETQCPFAAMGCEVVVVAKDRANHVDENTNGHLMLVARRMEAYQVQLSRMNKRVEQLERENAELKQQVSTNTVKLGKDMSNVEKQVKEASKNVSALQRNFNSEIRSHKK